MEIAFDNIAEGVIARVVATVLIALFGGGIWLFRNKTSEIKLPAYDRMFWSMAWVSLAVIIVFPILKIETPPTIPILLMFIMGILQVRIWWYKDK